MKPSEAIDALYASVGGERLLGVLDANGGKYGLQTMCEGGGVANVTIIEAV